ncbi:hypothetical protein CFRS1_v011690 [Colletotrichum fructicola]|nr:hypothetical protein CFRS1_v011690 [Colletotrichum fructicola]
MQARYTSQTQNNIAGPEYSVTYGLPSSVATSHRRRQRWCLDAASAHHLEDPSEPLHHHHDPPSRIGFPSTAAQPPTTPPSHLTTTISAPDPFPLFRAQHSLRGQHLIEDVGSSLPGLTYPS